VIGKTALLTTALMALMLVLAIAATAGAEEVGWRVAWVNPRTQQVPKSMWIDLYKMEPGITIPRGYAEEDGGYTFHIYFKTGRWIWWSDKPVEYRDKHAAFAWKVVAAWNASLKHAAENYEWGRHLSKLRLKFYMDNNVSQAPYIDIVVDPTKKSCQGFPGCTYFRNPIEIVGILDALSHELGHALGLGHNYEFDWPWGSVEWGYDWRGWRVGGIYPSDVLFSPPDTFVLYALSVRWSSLKNSTAGSPLSFPDDKTIRYGDAAGRLGLLYSEPGLVWAYYYAVISEPGGVEEPLIVGGRAEVENQRSLLMKPYPYMSWWSPVVFYGGTFCMHPLDWDYEFIIERVRYIYSDMRGRSELPLARVYPNNTALAMYGINISLALRDSSYSSVKSAYNARTSWVPKKYLTMELLKELEEDSILRHLEIIDGVGPAWDKVSGISYRDGRVCLEGLRDRVLVEMRLGRAYRVDAGLAEAVPVKGWSYRDSNGTNWVLKGSTVYFRPLNTSYADGGVKYLWRGANITADVDGPLTGSGLVDRLWRKQYLVEVDSPYPFEGVGWFDEGSRISPKPSGGYIDLGNGTRLVLKGFEGYDKTEIVVDRPLRLRPVWDRTYRVDTESRYVFAESGRYVKAGETLFVLMPRAQDFGNGSKIELVNITAYGPSGEVVKAWDGIGRGEEMALLQLAVDRPLTVRVSWNTHHRLTVTSPVNSYEAWVLNGTAHRLDLPERKLVGQDTLMVLKQVNVNGEPYRGLEVTVTSPTSVEAIYERRLMTTFMLDAGGGYLVEPSEVVLERDGETEVYRPPFTYIGEGVWRVASVTYQGGDVTRAATVEVNIAGMNVLPSQLRAVEVSVVDIFGIPIPYATVTAQNTGGATGLSGSTTIPAVPPWDFEAAASHALGRGLAKIGAGESKATITAGVSPYTIALLTIVAALSVVIWRRRERR